MSTNPLWIFPKEKEVSYAERRDSGNVLTSSRILDQVEFFLIFITVFIVFAVAAFIALLLPWTWSRRFGSDDKMWLIGRAWKDAGIFTEISFMG
jgi:hypothetical protein